MSVPQFEGKHDLATPMTPEDRLARRFDGELPDVPESVVVCYQTYFFDEVTDRDDVRPVDVATDQYDLVALEDEPGVGVVGNLGIGGPKTALVTEELVALGVQRFCIVGGCGALQTDLRGTTVLVAESAIRDDGTSHHYLPSARTVDAAPALTDELVAHADDARRGTTWTTDAFYRETGAELDHYADEGVLTVEMEAASLFAVACYRDVAAAAAFAPFDVLTADDWAWTVEDTAARLQGVFNVALAALRAA